MRRALAILAVLLAGPVAASAASPLDGEWITLLYQAAGGPYDVYMVRPDGTGLLNLTNGSANDYVAVVSPDHAHLALVSSDGSGAALWVMDATGSGRRQLVPPLVSDAAWTPDGRIVYSRSGRIHIVAVDGSGDRMVMEGLPGVALNLDVSPDGSTLVFDYQVGIDRQVYSVPLAGGAVSRLTTEGGSEPEYSPDGSQIVFVTFRAGYGSNIWVMGRDGSDQRNLFETGTNDFQPSWSPDGGRIVYEAVRDEDFAIVVRDLDTGAEVDVVTTPTAAAYRSPIWVPAAVPLEPVATTAAVSTSTVTTAGGDEQRSLDPVWIALVGALVATATIALLLAKKSPWRDEPPPPPPAG